VVIVDVPSGAVYCNKAQHTIVQTRSAITRLLVALGNCAVHHCRHHAKTIRNPCAARSLERKIASPLFGASAALPLLSTRLVKLLMSLDHIATYTREEHQLGTSQP
jgi:hypothetical protein